MLQLMYSTCEAKNTAKIRRLRFFWYHSYRLEEKALTPDIGRVHIVLINCTARNLVLKAVSETSLKSFNRF
jgi:hypothetical protein